jgi:hypothetical protein
LPGNDKVAFASLLLLIRDNCKISIQYFLIPVAPFVPFLDCPVFAGQ